MSQAAIPSPAAPPAPPNGVPAAPKSVAHRRELSVPTLADATKWLTYSASLAGIYLSVGFLFYFSMKDKLFTDGGTMPAPLAKAFDGSFFASVPGNNASWFLLGLLEASIVVLLAISLLRGEFLPQRRKPVLLSSLSVALFAFAFMAIAQNMIGGTPVVIELFTYTGVTIAVMFLIRQMPPYRPMSWLAGGVDES